MLWYTQVLYKKVCNFGILVISIVIFLHEAVHYSKHGKNN